MIDNSTSYDKIVFNVISLFFPLYILVLHWVKEILFVDVTMMSQK